ncbi:hypothetical protein [Accumulibacter sp.]|uniref:hypothetical protein n=1 Tax=Accumulibacter sp. TaxID=2053492 RepID=UPI002638E93A|nr:hypothetical protein [Accumulibacter sp.]
MSELRERMSNAMCLRGMAGRTQEAYIGALIELAKYYPTTDRRRHRPRGRYPRSSPCLRHAP